MAERVETELIVKAISQGFAGVKKDIENLGKAGKGAGDDLKGTNRSLGDMVQTIGRLQAGALVMAGVFKKAFDLAKEGAAIERTEMQLGRLAATIDSTAEAIMGRLGEATRGMIPNAQLAASAAQIISLGLATTEDDVVRLATVVGRLGLDMNQVILTFANNSIMRLDALGLSVDDVRARTAAFEAQGFDANKAFDTAVLEALEAKLQTLGGGIVDNAAIFARFETQIKNVSDAFKVWLAEGLTPVLAAITGLNSQKLEQIVDSQRDAAQGIEDFVAAGRRVSEIGDIWGGLGVIITGTSGIVRQKLRDIAADIATSAGSAEEFEDAFNRAFSYSAQRDILGVRVVTHEVLGGFYDLAQQTERLADALANSYQPATSQAKTETEKLAAAAEDTGIVIRDGTGAIAGWVGMMGMLGTGTSAAALSSRELAGATYEVRDAAAESLPGIAEGWGGVSGATLDAIDYAGDYKRLVSDAETVEQKLALTNLKEAWGLITEAEAEADRKLILLEQTHERVLHNMIVLTGGLSGGWYDAVGAAAAYRDILLEIEGIKPPSAPTQSGGGSPYGGSPPPGGTGGNGSGPILPPGGTGGTGTYQSPLVAPGGNGATNNAATYNIYVNGQLAAQIQGRMTAGTVASQIGVRG